MSWSSAAPAPPAPPASRAGATAGSRTTTTTWLRIARPWLVLLAAAATLAAVNPAMLGASGGPGWLPGTLERPVGVAGDRPTPRAAESANPLGIPRWSPPDAGPYRFIMLQPDTEEPVAYDPCRPLPYVVNERTGPPDGQAIVAEAVAMVSEVTGLQFRFEGVTDESPQNGHRAFQPDRYGDRWAPILVAWSDAGEVPLLAGDVAGIGGSTAVQPDGGQPRVFVSGRVALDGPELSRILARPYGRARVRGMIVHELAHVVGLDHVEDPEHLMHASGYVTTLQPGDIAGLARLGAGPCIAHL